MLQKAKADLIAALVSEHSRDLNRLALLRDGAQLVEIQAIELTAAFRAQLGAIPQ